MGGIAGAVGAFVVFPIDLVSLDTEANTHVDPFRSKLESRISGLTLLVRFYTRIPGTARRLSIDMKVRTAHSVVDDF
jgi:hypothetical protein